ncbi:MAG: hypothetical protein ACYCSQ_05625 [bacterium]
MKSDKKNKKDSPLFNDQQSEWLTEVLRLTAFVNTNPKSPEKWWKSVVSAQPTQRITHPFYSDIGNFGNGLMQLNIQPQSPQLFRIDWLYIPNPQLPHNDGLSNIGPLNEACKIFLPAMQKWLPLTISINRLAFGASLMYPVANLSEGCRYIAKYLKDVVKLDCDSSSDFLYQINRPSISKVANIEDLKINRVSKWSVAMVQSFEFTLAGQMSLLSPIEKSLQNTCKLEIDINTSPEYNKDIPHNKIKHIFKELVLFGKEITEKGDIK